MIKLIKPKNKIKYYFNNIMKKAKIYYIRPCDIRATRDEKVAYLQEHKFKDIPFERIKPDKNGYWLNIADNDWEELIPVANKKTKFAKKKSDEEAVFKLFASSIKTNRDEWVYDFDRKCIEKKMMFFVERYNNQISKNVFDDDRLDYSIKWSSTLKSNLKSKKKIEFKEENFILSLWRPFIKKYFYKENIFSDRLTSLHYLIWGDSLDSKNKIINFSDANTSKPFHIMATKSISDYHFLSDTQCLPLYRYDEEGRRRDNITDWGLERFRERYSGGFCSGSASEEEPHSNSPRKRGENLKSSLSACGEGRGEVNNENSAASEEEPLSGSPRKRGENSESGVSSDRENLKNSLSAHGENNQLDSLSVYGEGRGEVNNENSTASEEGPLSGSPRKRGENSESGVSSDKENLKSSLSARGENNQLDPLSVYGEGRGEVNNYGEEIQKEDIFYYTYAVLHNPAYREKYELNLKREFPRLPFYEDFWQWRNWGKELMDLHINFEEAEQYPLEIVEKHMKKDAEPKAKLKADKDAGEITLDEATVLRGVPKIAWEYKLGNRSALEWILDQYKEKKPRDPTIREKFNTYKFADYKDKVIDLLKRVTTVSVETMAIIGEMREAE